MLVDQRKKTTISMEPKVYDVFICHWHVDTQLNVVSVLRGILRSKGITCFIVGYGKESETEPLSDVLNVIKSSKVHVIFLSTNFASSKRCLEEVLAIMKTQDSSEASDASPKPKVLPVFYDVEPSTFRHQQKDYEFSKISGSSPSPRSVVAERLDAAGGSIEFKSWLDISMSPVMMGASTLTRLGRLGV
ncbi:hypothetical protein KP509_08G026900 [Ceratopteris richardii]|nr:hypothetical protein KP509_08G026900 [Ceratopteris richardii]